MEEIGDGGGELILKGFTDDGAEERLEDPGRLLVCKQLAIHYYDETYQAKQANFDLLSL